MIKNTKIDNGREFDWGRTSGDYAKYRDIYPKEFYQKLLDMDLCVDRQKVLDIGTGTGVLPRNLYRYGAEFTGIDISKNQIEQAVLLAKKSDMAIDFQCVPAEKIDYPCDSFDVVTACQCFTYFNHEELAPKIHKMLKPNGRFVVLYMAWLPFEDLIAGKSEALILKYNPVWTGCKEMRHPISIPEDYKEYFTLENQEVFDVSVSFNRESWNGRMKSCRGIEASLSPEEVRQFDQEHRKLLEEIAPEDFTILHYAAITVLRKN
ncbi:class I SAM-dependent methyltransferase [uncultured Robinsoniella sp.]|uniref:class I SAM-dependent methyltransferase n=1 Tax=uncultured Robinsoniella sp. TaxID=904190 RepID=UPI00374EFE77